MLRSRPDPWSRFGGIDKRIAQRPVTGIITVDFVPTLAHCESRDLDWRFENPQRMHAYELGVPYRPY